MTEQQHTSRGFQIAEIEVADYRGEKPRTLQVQESSSASERKVWLGQKNGPAHGEPGRRFHLNEDQARQVRDALTRFLGDERPPAPSAVDVLHEVVTRIDEARYVNEARYNDDTSAPWANTDVLELLAHLRHPYTEGGVTEARTLSSQLTPSAERITTERLAKALYEERNSDEDFQPDDPALGFVPIPASYRRQAERLIIILGWQTQAATLPRIEDMAPGTTFTASYGKDLFGTTRWMRCTGPSRCVNVGGVRFDAYAIDPSTIRDVTRPPAAAEVD